MPYRYAHHGLLLVLVPAILFAFWPGYFGDLRNASFAFHAHGLTASGWILLVAAQSWTVHGRRLALHRWLGRAVFAMVPLFAAGGALAMRSMAIKYLGGSDPLYAAIGPLLGLDDLISTAALVLFVRAALVHRRRVAIHGGYMLATVMLVVPPIVARLGLPFPLTWHAGEVIAAIPAVALALLEPRHARPFLVLLGVLAFKVVADTWAGFTPAWLAIFTALPAVAPPLLALGTMIAAFALLWSGWRPAPLFPPRARQSIGAKGRSPGAVSPRDAGPAGRRPSP